MLMRYCILMQAASPSGKLVGSIAVASPSHKSQMSLTADGSVDASAPRDSEPAASPSSPRTPTSPAPPAPTCLTVTTSGEVTACLKPYSPIVLASRRGVALSERYITNRSGPRLEVAYGLTKEELAFAVAVWPLLLTTFGEEHGETIVPTVWTRLINDEFTLCQLKRYTARPQSATRQIMCALVHALYDAVEAVAVLKPTQVMRYILPMSKGMMVEVLVHLLINKIELVTAVRIAEFCMQNPTEANVGLWRRERPSSVDESEDGITSSAAILVSVADIRKGGLAWCS